MKGDGSEGGGWFKVGHDAWDLILRECEPTDRPRVLLTYGALSKIANARRAPTFEASRNEVATTSRRSRAVRP